GVSGGSTQSPAAGSNRGISMHHIDLRYAATRIAVAVAAAAALAGTAVTGAGAATRGQGAAPRAHVTATPGTRLWVRRLNGTGNDSDVALSAAVSPGGGRVFVTGEASGSPPVRTSSPPPTGRIPAPSSGPGATTAMTT